MSRNEEIARLLDEFADLLAARGVEYKPRAYEKAAQNVREHPKPIEDLAREGTEALGEIDRVGEAIAGKIEEYFETGEIEELSELRADLPVDMAGLTAVEGVGPKTVGTLHEALGIRTLDDLEAAAEAGDIQSVEGFGPKTEQNILENVEFAREATERALLGDARPRGESVREYLAALTEVSDCDLAGSIRRWQETIGDVDVLVGSEDPEAVVDAFTEWPEADLVIEAGTSKASVRSVDMRVDLRVVTPDEYGAALQYFTGSKAHNVALRNRAIDRDMKMNEYGVFDVSDVADADEAVPEAGDDEASDDDGVPEAGDDEASDNDGVPEAGDDEASDDDGIPEAGGKEAGDDDQRAGKRLAGETEAGMYEALDLPWLPPELRAADGEIEAADAGTLPDLLEESAIRGDLHVHSDWSDGTSTVAEMVESAAAFGHDYLAICDHATGPGMVGGVGVDDDVLREELAEIRAVAAEADIEVFAGVEANVDAEGGISVADDLLADLDLVVASPHSALSGDGTDRLVTAVEHPAVDVLGHPTGRYINGRPGLDVDVERLARAAADQDTALEVNANPRRLDLGAAAVRTAIGAGATIAIDTDAHRPSNYGLVQYGVHTARRGWAEPEDVLNTRSAEGIREFVE
ncbi:MAG: helix-hairpin-helix domain-containing protein [Haloarculaceae archaeon]